MDAFTVGAFLSLINTKVIDYLAGPVRQKFPDMDMWWLLYVAAVTGFVICWFANINLFEAHVANVLLGRILSGLVVGGGSSLIHDVFDQPNIVELTSVIESTD